MLSPLLPTRELLAGEQQQQRELLFSISSYEAMCGHVSLFCLPHPVTWVLGLVTAFAGYGDASFPDSGYAATECLWLLC